ncbi:exodeoxyribonuclease V subunit beta, partial [Photobacterium sp. OFAV2-7]|uniref:exodeoxyribonuclease V subunit beta n=1 Tax=Photobacterium sp. OFAV2-7 TaxID=2917748 RepID=UPI001EF4C758
MIYLIQGRPKSGKSYEAVKYHIIPAIKSGRKVITNLPLVVEHFVKIFGAEVRDLIKVVDSYDTSNFDSGAADFHFSKPEHYMDEWRDENNKGPLFVVDECHFALPRGKVLPEVIKYFTMHGHYGVDILLLTQNVRQTDTNILGLVEVMYRTIKNTALGSTKTYTKKVLDGYRGAVVNTEQRKYDDKIFPYYKAFTGSQGAVEAAGPSDVKPIWQHWSVIGSVVLLGGVLIFVLSGGVRSPFAMKEPVETVQEAEQETTGYKLPKTLEKFSQQVLFDKTSKGNPPEHPVFVAIEALLANRPNVKDPLLAHAIKECRQLLAEAKRRKGWLSFDDLLTQLAAALANDTDGSLAARIRGQFPVAMIDEFQDTDPLQYSIFNTVYGDEHCSEGEGIPVSGLFMIGDPKQAIYAFRGADIFTYIRARRQVTAHYTLGTNWRSTAEMVEAVNRIFQQPQRPFIYDQDITFLPVKHSPKAADRSWQLAGEKQPALSFWRQDADEPVKKGGYNRVMAAATAAEIQKILTLSQQGEALLVDGEKSKPIRAGDVSVLVRTGSEGAMIRQALAEQGIASVYLSNRDSVFSCSEASDIQRLLVAVLIPEDERGLRAALASGLFALSARQLDELNADEDRWEQHVAEFREYRKLWQSRGVLPMLRHVLASRRIPERLLSENGGERRLTDILHLGELLQQASQTLDSDHGLLRWLAEHIEAPNGNADEQQLRLESDRNLVQIVTIHKSKGLEYDIVFLPFVCSYRAAGTALFHDEQTQQAVLDVTEQEESMELAEKERLAEDLRLIYVALTRAVYGCYIGMAPLRNGLSRKEPTGLHKAAIGWLVQDAQEGGIAELDAALARLTSASSTMAITPPPVLPELPWCPDEGEQPELSASEFTAKIERNWWITSYSGLVKQGSHNHDASFELPGFDTDSSQDSDSEDGELIEPERSIYTFPRGARPGTFLHTLFEEIEFTEPVESEATRDKILELLRLENYDEVWLPVLQTMIRDVLNCALDGDSLQLGHIPARQRLTEMEFMLPINVLSAPLLNKVI